MCGIGAIFCLQIYLAKLFLFSEVSHLFSRYWTGLERIFLAGLGKHCFVKLPRTKEFYLKVILWIIPRENILFRKFFCGNFFLQFFFRLFSWSLLSIFFSGILCSVCHCIRHRVVRNFNLRWYWWFQVKTFYFGKDFFSKIVFAIFLLFYWSLLSTFFWTFFAVFATISDTGSGGEHRQTSWHVVFVFNELFIPVWSIRQCMTG